MNREKHGKYLKHVEAIFKSVSNYQCSILPNKFLSILCYIFVQFSAKSFKNIFKMSIQYKKV